MELLQLYYFQVTARFQHISKAAACLHITQPALSQTIKRLEKELETELFDRVGKEIVLNEKGEILLKYANSVLSSVESAKAELADYCRRETNTLSRLRRSSFPPCSSASGSSTRRRTSASSRTPSTSKTRSATSPFTPRPTSRRTTTIRSC